MNILAFDTSTQYESIALSCDGQIVADITQKTSRTHSERLLPAVNDLMSQINMKMQDISAIAVSLGPGSFTGLRIGLSTAKGLCFGLKIPLYTVSTLRSLANNACPTTSPICVLMDAGRSEYYYAIYSNSLSETQRPSFEKIEKILQKVPDNLIFIGPAVHKARTVLDEAKMIIARHIDCYPKAVSLIDIIENNKQYDVYSPDNIAQVEPLYIRKSAAEENRNATQQKNKKS